MKNIETKSVVQFALLFGTTWFVNSLVFAGILLAGFGAGDAMNGAGPARFALLFRLPRGSRRL